MNTSLVNDPNKATAEIQTLVSNMLSAPVDTVTQLNGGANSQVYRIQTGDGAKYAVKVYFTNEQDSRDRLGVEFNSLSFLWEEGIRNIPQPIAINREEQIAVYKFIEGESIDTSGLTEKDIDDAISFLVQINELRCKESAQQLPTASEAFFTPNDVFQNLLLRLSRLYEVNKEREGRGELRSFLMSGIKPYLNIAREWSQRNLTQAHVFFEKELPAEYRILSPSDFGFHNALRGQDGQVYFLDLEYFGWDDPAKTACDFLLHPAMNLSDDLKKYFVQKFIKAFSDDEKLAKRVEYLYPLFGIKWSLIMLNEFIPEEFSRREHACESDLDIEQLQKDQLMKSRNMLRSVKEIYQKSPYKETE